MTFTIKHKAPLTVPSEVQRRAGFKPCDQVEFKVSHGVVTILPKRIRTPASDDTLTPAEGGKSPSRPQTGRAGQNGIMVPRQT